MHPMVAVWSEQIYITITDYALHYLAFFLTGRSSSGLTTPSRLCNGEGGIIGLDSHAWRTV